MEPQLLLPKSPQLRLPNKRRERGFFYNLIDKIRERFNLPIPQLAIAMGFPSRRSRGRSANRSVGEILVQEWKGDEIEKALLTIHPERFVDAETVALSALLLVGDEIYGSRRHSGALSLGVMLNKEDGSLEYTKDEKGAHTRSTLKFIIKESGELPNGHAELPEPKPVQRTLMQKYVCNVCGKILRAAINPEAIHSTDNGTYLLSVKAAKPAKTAAKTEAPVVQNPQSSVRGPVTQRENIEN
jgi:hypothetical protein